MNDFTLEDISKLLNLVRREISSLDPYGNCHLDTGPESNAVVISKLQELETKLCYEYNTTNATGG